MNRRATSTQDDGGPGRPRASGKGGPTSPSSTAISGATGTAIFRVNRSRVKHHGVASWLVVPPVALALVLTVVGCDSDNDPYKDQGPFPTALAPVPAGTAATASPLPITAAVDFGNKVTVSVPGTRSIRSGGTGPGELANKPAVAFTIELRNDSGHTIDLGPVTVTVSYGATSTPATADSGPENKPMRGTLKSGAAASGVYVFLIPEDQRENVATVISYDASQPAVVLTGHVG